MRELNDDELGRVGIATVTSAFDQYAREAMSMQQHRRLRDRVVTGLCAAAVCVTTFSALAVIVRTL